MKKVIILLILTIFLHFPIYYASAEEIRYSRIVSEDVYLYMDSSLTIPWFILPVGYSVKVLSVNSTSAKVEYKGDSPLKPSAKGYVAIEHLNILDFIPSPISPTLVLTVNQTCLMYKDLDFTISETVTPTSTVEYYGYTKRSNGEKLVYGLINATSGDKYVGFIPMSAVYDFVIPSLPIEDDKNDESESHFTESSTPPEVSNALGDSLQLVIIIAVSLVAVSIVYILFHPSEKRTKDEVITSVELDDE